MKTVPKTEFENDTEETITDTIFDTKSRNNGFTQVSISDELFHNPEEDEDPNEYAEIDEFEIADAAAGFAGMPDYDDEAADRAFNKYDEDTDPAKIPETPDDKKEADDNGQDEDAFNEIINMAMTDDQDTIDIADQIMQETENNSKNTEPDKIEEQ